MKSNLLYLLPAMLLLLTACPSDSKEDDPAPKRACLLQEQSGSTSFNGKSTAYQYTYTYNSKNQLTTVSLDSVYSGNTARIYSNTLRYDNKNNLTEVTGSWHIKNSYDEKGRVTKHSRYIDGKVISFYFLTYNSENELLRASQYAVNGDMASLLSTWHYNYSKGNPIQIVQTGRNSDFVRGAHITYDAKPRPLPAMHHEEFEPFVNFPSENNILRYTLSDREQTIEDYLVNYTYNDQSFPVSAIKKYGPGLIKSSGFTETILSSYTCN